MRILVVGGGGREHALVWRLAQNPTVDRLYAAPGNAGIAADATCMPIAAEDVPGIVELVERESIDLTVVGPEAPLVAGLADELEAGGRRVFGPTRDAARIEGSKAWAKELCERCGIPAGRSRAFTELAPGVAYLDELEPPYVIKADGLAAGKGVVVAEDRSDAVAALEACLVERAFGDAGATVLVEEHLTGREVSAFALTDGREVLPLAMAQDFKRAGDGDTGPNTGGMGAYSPVPWVDDATERRIWNGVLGPAVRAMEAEGVRYRGVLYAGLMLTDDGPKLLEFNCRFGDPEAQVILPLLETDLVSTLIDVLDGNEPPLIWRREFAACVVLASRGYPARHQTGMPILGLDAVPEDVLVFHAGTRRDGGSLVTAGGRVLNLVGRGSTLTAAVERAYEGASRVEFEGKQFRRDIGRQVPETVSIGVGES